MSPAGALASFRKKLTLDEQSFAADPAKGLLSRLVVELRLRCHFVE